MTFRSSFNSASDRSGGRSPFVIDILAPDMETSLLPGDLKMVLHVNPNTMKMTYQKLVERIQTKGGFVEQHHGDGVETMSLDHATGGFMRLYSGLSNITGDGRNVGGSRRETIAYDKYMDMLALFHNNGAVYDLDGSVIFQGIIKISFDGFDFLGWFQAHSKVESADQPYQFTFTNEFLISKEIMGLRSLAAARPSFNFGPTPGGEEEVLGQVGDLPPAASSIVDVGGIGELIAGAVGSGRQAVENILSGIETENRGASSDLPSGRSGFDSSGGG